MRKWSKNGVEKIFGFTSKKHTATAQLFLKLGNKNLLGE
jgi:hypothetical protein